MQTTLDFLLTGNLGGVARATLLRRMTRKHWQQKSPDERGAAADTESLFLRQTTALKIRQAQHKKPRNARQFPAVWRQAGSFALSLNQLSAEEILQLFDLPAVLALPYRVVIGGLHNAASGAHLQQGFQTIQRKAAFCKKPGKHD